MSEPRKPDAYAPAEMAARVEAAGIAKARNSGLPLLMLALLAGAFIAFGGMFYTLVMTDNPLGFGPARLVGGLAFSLGLILVLVGGAELFTGNSLIVMAWADGKVTTAQLLRNWGVVYLGNFLGAAGTVGMVALSGVLSLGNGRMADVAAAIATGKLALPWHEALMRGVLCNILVCLAVWLCFSARSVTDKILAILLPVSAFVALGFEHSVANMYLIPVGLLAGGLPLDAAAFLGNLLPVTIGNIIGGGVFVAAVYFVIYIRPSR